MLTAAILATAVLAAPAPRSGNTTRHVGEDRSCVGGKWHNIKYDATVLDSTAFVDLDTMSHLKGVTCDIDHTRIKLHFTSEVYSAEWLVKFHDLTDHYLIGGVKWDCPMVDQTRGGLIIRRVVGAGLSGNYITVTAAEAMYDEIYQDADISFNTEGSCTAEDEKALGKDIDKDVCVGWNSDCTSGAKATIPLFSNKAMTLSCDECFVDFHVDVFIDFSIRGFAVQNLSAGFRNMYANGSLVLGAIAKANWNAGIDKTIDLVPTTNLINFKVGPVPFMIYFDMPVEVTTDATFNTEADATFGAALDLKLGDAFVNWNPTTHWTHTKPTPVMTFTPHLTTAATLSATASASVVPTLTAHFDKVLSYQITAKPQVNLDIEGSEATKQVCAKSTYQVSVNSVTDLNINIPWANIHDDKTFPADVYESGVQPIEDKCVNL
jgi:hypothetical protein